MDGLIAPQSSPSISPMMSMALLSNCSTLSSSKSPPLKCNILSAPKYPPVFMARNNWRNTSAKSFELRRVCWSKRGKSFSGKSPISSANKQNNKRMRKCATACGSSPNLRNTFASVENCLAASWVTCSIVSCGLSCSGSKNTGLRVLTPSAVSRSSSVRVIVRVARLV